jgi:dTDP-4-dehydrorhamnose reductase
MGKGPMVDRNTVIITGGSGLLGSAFRKIEPLIRCPGHKEFDVCNYEQMDSYIQANQCTTIIHAAAFTSPPRIDKDPLKAIDVNIIGTSNIVKLCMRYRIRLIYISTDYVFKGDKGNYKETDSVYPVNKYAWSKLGGECAVRMYDNALIVRTSFGPDIFPFEKAFTNQWTSREAVSAVAKKIISLIDSLANETIHIGSKRRTVFEYAQSLDRNKKIDKLSIHDVSFCVPEDTSLDCEKFNRIFPIVTSEKDRVE